MLYLDYWVWFRDISHLELVQSSGLRESEEPGDKVTGGVGGEKANV